MSRTSTNQIKDGKLWNGYDYENQAWVREGKYINCGHPEDMDCGCYGREHEGEQIADHSAIKEEVEAYFAINGETGGWGESMRDNIGIDIICKQIEDGHNIKITDKIKGLVEKELFNHPKEIK